MKERYFCTILTQGSSEYADGFNIRINEIVNSKMSEEKTIVLLPVQITSDSNGRKEAFIQWMEPNEVKPNHESKDMIEFATWIREQDLSYSKDGWYDLSKDREVLPKEMYLKFIEHKYGTK